MRKNFSLTLNLIFVALLATSCVNIPMQRLLDATSNSVTDELIVKFKQSAMQCGFTEIYSEPFSSGTYYVYLYARTKYNRLEITLEQDLRPGKELFIGEANYDRGINEGFTESDLKQFSCVENKIKESLPDAFEWK
jgi:hypothetical protein